MISLLSSGSGPLQPSKKIGYQDIKVGIPSVLLCIEMSIFSVMHLFAFPWKEYKISPDPLAMHGAGYSGGEPKYKGAMKAMVDVFNPWDMIKASARGFRWLFVGYRKRTNDISYQGQNKPNNNSGSTENPYSGTDLQPGATELRPSEDGRQARATTELGEDDRAGLLRHSATPAQVALAAPYREYTNDEFAAGDDSVLDLGAAAHHSHPVNASSAEASYPTDMSKASDYVPGSDADTGYHPGVGPGGVHPALRSGDNQEDAWDHWAGAQRPS